MNYRIHRLLTGYLALLLVVVLQAPSQAQQQFEGQINFTKAMAENVRQMSRELEFSGKELGELYAKDSLEAVKWSTERADQWEKAAALFEANKPQEAQDLMQSLKGDYNRWREQLLCRQQQKRFAPDEKWLADTRKWMVNGDDTAFNKFVESRKTLSEAWGKLGDIMRPETDEKLIIAGRDKISIANVESEIAEVRVHWGRDDRDLVKDRALTPELDKKVGEILAAENEMAEIRRQRNDLDLKTQELDRKRRDLMGEANNIANDARQKQQNQNR